MELFGMRMMSDKVTCGARPNIIFACRVFVLELRRVFPRSDEVSVLAGSIEPTSPTAGRNKNICLNSDTLDKVNFIFCLNNLTSLHPNPQSKFLATPLLTPLGGLT